VGQQESGTARKKFSVGVILGVGSKDVKNETLMISIGLVNELVGGINDLANKIGEC